MKYLFSAVLFTLCAAAGFGQSGTKEIDFSVNGISTSSSYREVIKKLGKPKREVPSNILNECTGGYSRTLYYDGLEIELDGDKKMNKSSVVMIKITSTKWKMSSGIRIGETVASLKQRLGEPAALADGDQKQLVYGLTDATGPGAVDFDIKNGKVAVVTLLATIC